MNQPARTSSTDLAPWEQPGEDIGIEMTSAEVSLPRLKILGRDGVFENPLTSEVYEELDCIILGSLKARVMWDKEVSGDERPMCKSLDAVVGMPNLSEETPVNKRFPLESSSFTKSDLVLRDGIQTLPCDKCSFAQWDNVRNKPALCAEQFVLPLLFRDSSNQHVPGVLSLQRSAMKNTKRYLGQFLSSRTPTFSVGTRISLEKMQRGQVVYSVPRFQRGEPTDRSEWQGYWDLFTDARTLLRTVRRPDESSEGDASGAAKGDWAAATAPKKAEQAPAEAKAEAQPADEDLVF